MNAKSKDGSAGLGSLEELLMGTPLTADQVAPLEDLETNKPIGEATEEKSSLKENIEKTEELEVLWEEKNSEKQKAKPQETEGESESYKKVLKKLFGKYVDKVVSVDDEGNEVESSIEEMDIDSDLFTDIAAQAMSTIKKEITTDKISTEGLSEMTLKIVEMEKNGATPEEMEVLYGLQEQVTNPLENLDLTSREDQIAVIFMHQRAHGQQDEDTQILVRGYESQGVLEEKARKAEGQLKKAVADRVKAINDNVLQQKAEREEREKKLKKEFKDNLNIFQLNDTSKSKIYDFAFKKDPARGGFTDMEIAYTQAMSDPEKAVKLALLLRDEEEFIKQVSNAEVIKDKLETASKIRVVLSKNSHTGEKTKSGKSTSFGDLSELKL